MAIKSGLLSKGQRAYLNGEKEPNNANHERTIRNRLKDRIGGGFSDLALIQTKMSPAVREDLFEDGLETRPPKGNPEEAGEFEQAINRTLALILHGLVTVYPLSYVEAIMEIALKHAENDRRDATETRVFRRYRVTIEEIELPPVDEAIAQLEEGDVTAEAVESLLKHDLITPLDLTDADGVEEVLEKARKE